MNDHNTHPQRDIFQLMRLLTVCTQHQATVVMSILVFDKEHKLVYSVAVAKNEMSAHSSVPLEVAPWPYVILSGLFFFLSLPKNLVLVSRRTSILDPNLFPRTYRSKM